jgi:hypothetical protein
MILPIIASPVAAASYPADCDGGAEGPYQRYAAKYWPGGSYLKYYGSHGETRVRDLLPCVNGDNKGGWSAVWAANLDNLATGTGYVQLGYAEATSGYCFTGGCGRKFVYTPDDSTDPPGKFEVLSVPVLGNTPIVGHRYEFKIKSVIANPATGARGWEYCIEDHDGDGIEHCKITSASFSQATRSLHMFETQNSKDVLGNRDDQGSTVQIVEMAYMTTNLQWFDFDPSSCSNGESWHPDYRCVDSGTNDIHGYTISD